MRIKIHCSFLVYVLILLFFELLEYYLFFLISIFLHEIAHAITGKIFGIKTSSLSISFSGLSLKFEDFNISKTKRIIILIVGPIVNLLIALIAYFLYQEKYIFFVICNLLLFAFNILPIYPLDGGKILYETISQKNTCEVVQKFFCLVLVIACIYMYINYQTIQVMFLGIYLLGFANLKKYDKYF